MYKKISLIMFFLMHCIIYSFESYDYTFLEGHKSSVSCIAFSYDSKYLATGSFDTTIKIWDLKANQPINTIVHGAIVESLAFSTDNKLLASVGRDKCVKTWDLKTGNLKHVFGPLNDFVFSVIFSPDNKNILIGSYKYIYIFDIKNNLIVNKLDIGNIWARCIKFSPDNEYFGVCGGNEVTIYNVKNSKNLIKKLLGKKLDLTKMASYKTSSYVYSFDFSYDSQYFAFGNEQGDIYLYRTLDGLFMWNKNIYDSLIWSVSFSCNKTIAVSGKNKNIILLDALTGNIINILHTDCDEIFSTLFSYDSKYIISSGKDTKVRIWKSKKASTAFKKKYLYIIESALTIIMIFIFIIIYRAFNKKSSVKDWKL
jgi:WD40 repeat protein